MLETKEEIKTIFRSASLASTFNIIGYGISFIVGVFIARLVGPKIYGVIAVGLSLVSILQVFATVGMDKALFKYISFFFGQNNFNLIKKTIAYALVFSILLSTIIIIVFFVAYGNIIDFFSSNKKELSLVLQYFIFLVPILSINSLLSNSFTGLQRPHIVQLVNGNFRPTIRLALLVVLMIWISSRLRALVWATMLAYVITGILLIYVFWKILYKNSSNNIQLNVSRTVFDYRAFIKFSLPLALIPIFNLVTQQFDTLIVAHFLSASDTGVYAVVRKVGNLTLMPLAMFGGLIVVTISKFYASGKEKMVPDFYELGTKWIMFISGFIFILFFTFSREFLALFGQKFVHGEGSLLLRIFIVGQLVNASVGPSGNLLLILNKNIILVLISFFAAIISIVLSFILIPKYKLIGAGFSLTVTFTIINLFAISYIYKVFGVKAASFLNYIKRFFIISVVLFLALVLNNYLVFNNIYLKIFLFSVFIFIILLLLVYFIEGITDEDKYVLDIFYKKIRK